MRLKVPEGIHLELLPPHSPKLQPSGKLWPLSDERGANRHFERTEELEEALIERCVALGEQPEVIHSYLATIGGLTPRELAELMGHSDLSQVMKYALSDEKRARAGVGRL